MAHQQIGQTLRLISAVMQQQGLWQNAPPSDEKLASTLPFCVDTLTFSEWLQWVMYPKLIVIVETKATLPANSNMASMAEQAFKKEPSDTRELLALIVQLDQDITT
jgi:uncharacterized protein YqcC (DUF446 family)